MRIVPPFPHPDGKPISLGWDVTNWVQTLRLAEKDDEFIREALNDILHASTEFDPENLPDWIGIEISDKSDKTSLMSDEPEPWGEPMPLEEFVLPSWPDDLLPEPLGSYVTALSKSLETPVELAALASLPMISTCVQGKYRLQVRGDHSEEIAIWALAALPPGERKTAALEALRFPLDNWQHEQAEMLRPEIDRVNSIRQTLEVGIKHKRTLAGKETDPIKQKRMAEEIAELEADLPVPPVSPCLSTADITPEKLGAMMGMHDERMSILSDEAGIFGILAGRYSNGNVNLDLFNQAFSGSSYRADRLSRNPVELRHPVLSMALNIQPEALSSMQEKSRFRGLGLLGRFLYVIPHPAIGSRNCKNHYEIPELIRSRYSHMIHSLLEDRGDRDERDCLTRRTLQLSPEAVSLWIDFIQEIEHRMAEGKDLEGLGDWGSKLQGTITRVAAIFHAVRYSSEVPLPRLVGREEMERAVRLGHLLIPHAMKAFNLMQVDPEREDARSLLAWIKRSGFRVFSVRKIHRANYSRFSRVSNIRSTLRFLEEYGCIRKLESEQTIGRPSEQYEVNPHFLI